uniref:hypothetical protein n=1 Tax=Megasphaera micronuciformis TaxID=187326 RepID=UPI00402898E6
MFHAFEAVTTFHLFALVVIGAGGAYACRKGSVSVRSVVLHNLICVLRRMIVTLYASEGIALWAGLFVASLFLTHVIFGKKGGYGQLQRRVPVTGGIFRPYMATAFVLSFLQLALYFVPTLRYLWITSLVSPVVGGMLAGVVFSYSDRVVKSEKKG